LNVPICLIAGVAKNVQDKKQFLQITKYFIVNVKYSVAIHVCVNLVAIFVKFY